MFNFQRVKRYGCLNVTHNKCYKWQEGKTKCLNCYIYCLFTCYQYISNSSMHIRGCSHEIVLSFFYEGNIIHKAINQFSTCVYFVFVHFAFHSTPQTEIDKSEIWGHWWPMHLTTAADPHSGNVRFRLSTT